VTKDKRSGGGWKKCLVWTFVAFAFAAIVAVGVLVAGESTLCLCFNVEFRQTLIVVACRLVSVGAIPQSSDTEGKLAQVGSDDFSTTSTPSSIIDAILTSSATTTTLSPLDDLSTSTSSPSRPPPVETHGTFIFILQNYMQKTLDVMVVIIWRLCVVVVAHAARAEFSLTNMTFEAALANKS